MTADRAAQLNSQLPLANSTRERAIAFMQALDLSVRHFAQLAGYGYTAMNAFLKGHYEVSGAASDLLIREALESFMERHPLGARTDQGAPLYETENVAQMRHWFSECLQYGHMAVIYGPPGSQKTFVAEHLVAEVNRRELGRESSRDRAYLVRCSIGIRPRDLVAKICRELNVPTGNSLQRCLTSIRMAVRDRRILLVIDEGQLAGIPALEALRELHDVDRIGLLLLGSHALRQLFDQRAAELEQFNSRIEDLIELTGVSEQSARAILAAELPRLNNTVASRFIEAAFVTDIYSRTKGKQYCSVRRLFKSIAAYKAQTVPSTPATPTVPEVIQ